MVPDAGTPTEPQPSTVPHAYATLRQILALAVDRSYIASNPCDKVRLKKKRSSTSQSVAPKPRHLYLSHQEVRALAEAMPTETYRVATYVAAYCGLRAGELGRAQARRRGPTAGYPARRRGPEGREHHEPHLLPSEKGLLFGPPKSDSSNRTMALPGPIRDMLKEYLSQPLPGGDGPRSLIFTTPSGTPIRQTLFYSRAFKPTLKG